MRELKIIPYSFWMFIITFGGHESARALECKDWQDVPFATSGGERVLQILPEDLKFRLLDNGRTIQFPKTFLPIHVVDDVNMATVVFARRLFTGENYTFLYQAGVVSDPISFPDSQKQNIVFQAFKLNEYIYYIYYNVVSLRCFLQRLKVGKTSIQYDETFILPLEFGSSHISNHTIQIDVIVRPLPHYNTEQAFMAGGDSVVAFHEEVTPQLKTICVFEGYTFIKSISCNQGVTAVFRRDALAASDPLLKAYNIDSQTEAAGSKLLGGALQMPRSVWNLGDNNHEGLVVWSQVYYLNGFINLLKDWPNAESSVPSADLQFLRKRLDIEMYLLDRMVMETDLISYRYSMDRAPLFSALHAARVHRLMRRYSEELPNPIELPSKTRVAEWLENLNHPQEILEKVVHGGSQILGQLPANDLYLGIKRGVPFFHDGVNAPWNFITSHIGELSTRPHLSPDNAKLIRDSIRAFVKCENFDDLPRANHEWHYNWGKGKRGRVASDRISINRPNYPPDAGMAHISYRTMDLIGLLSAASRFPDALPRQFRSYAVKAVAEGGVWPFVYEEVEDYEFPLDTPTQQFWLLYTAPYEFQAASIAALSKRPNPKAVEQLEPRLQKWPASR